MFASYKEEFTIFIPPNSLSNEEEGMEQGTVEEGMEEGKKRLATLVGCNYSNTRNELYGCINDVLAMRQVLVSRFGFHLEDIELLTDEPGSPVMPTGANIRRALNHMVDMAKPGDVLFFHYSGHGTLMPSVKPHHQRGSRHDEAIVPCDFNLITDVDFRQLVDRMPSGATLTIVSDSCHSGGLIHNEKEQIGPSTTIDRAASLRRPKIIPYESVLDHLTSLSGIASPNIVDHLLGLFGGEVSAKFLGGSLPKDHIESEAGILLSGCQSDETSADMSLEDGTEGAYGAFSNSIQMVLKEHRGKISNRELVTKTRELLSEQGFTQHPCLYCSDENADAPFLPQPDAVAASDAVAAPELVAVPEHDEEEEEDEDEDEEEDEEEEEEEDDDHDHDHDEEDGDEDDDHDDHDYQEEEEDDDDDDDDDDEANRSARRHRRRDLTKIGVMDLD